MKTKLIFLSVFLTSAFFVNDVFSQMHKQHSRKGETKHKCVFMEDLSEAQKTKIDEIKTAKRAKLVSYRADLKIKNAELSKMRVADNPNESLINAKVDEISELRAKMRKERLAAERAILNELTPEQRVKYRAHIGKRGHEGHMHHSSKRQMKNKGMHGNCPHSK